MIYLGYFLLASIALGLLVTFWPLALAIVALYVAYRVIRVIRKNRYFASEEFLGHKEEIQSVVAEHNELAEYVDEIRNNGKFSIGKSLSGANSHLASFQNTSKFDYKRDKNKADFSDQNLHNASLQVVRNASIEPIKYLIKYFNIETTEDKLSEIESLGESISRLENAVNNLSVREAGIAEGFGPPRFILKHYLKEFQSQVGLSIPQLQVPYPKYTFQYMSAGGNSAQKTEIVLTSTTVDSLIEEVSAKIKFRKSAAGQRALMTARLREHIKARDLYSCKTCQISVSAEPHLLLEVDHIMPVSKGGLSIEENLQTLCWKCNRSKANKVLD